MITDIHELGFPLSHKSLNKKSTMKKTLTFILIAAAMLLSSCADIKVGDGTRPDPQGYRLGYTAGRTDAVKLAAKDPNCAICDSGNGWVGSFYKGYYDGFDHTSYAY